MKVILCSHASTVYGAPRSIMLTSVLLRQKGHEICLIFPSYGGLIRVAQELGIETKVIKIKTFGLRTKFKLLDIKCYHRLFQSVVSRLNYIYELYNFIKERKPDIIHVNTVESIYSGLVARISKVPCVWHIRERNILGFGHALKKMLIRLCAKEIIFVSDAIRNSYKYIGKKGRVLYNFVEANAEIEKIACEYVRIGFFGSIREDKGAFDFVKICYELKKFDVPFKAYFVGSVLNDLTEKQLKSIIAELNLQDQIQFMGEILKMEDIFKFIDILIHPTHKDSLPRVVMEAMSFGIPVVASRVDGIPEMVNHGETGYLFECKEIVSAAYYIKELIDNPEQRKRMGKAGRERAAAIYDAEGYYNKLLAIYIDARRVKDI